MRKLPNELLKMKFRGNSPNTLIKFFTLTFHHGFYNLFQKIGGQKFQIDGAPLHTNFQKKQGPTIVELSCSNPAGHPLSLPPWLWHWGVSLSLPAFPSRWSSTAISLGCQEGQQAPCRIPGFSIKSTVEKSVEILIVLDLYHAYQCFFSLASDLQRRRQCCVL